MNLKLIFADGPKVILWLTFSSFLFAQAPERTKPASETKTKPCWEQVMKTMGDGMVCLGELSEQLEAQRNNQKALEELELAGVRFLKVNGYPEESAVAIIARKIKQLSSTPVAETSERAKPAEAKPTPAASEETPRQVELVKRNEAAEQKKRLRDERREGWKAGLPQPEKSTGNCWEETHPNDLVGCIAQLEQYINQVREDTTLSFKGRRLAVKNFIIYLEKLKKLEKSAEKGVKTQRTWGRSRAIAGVGEVCPQMWVSEGHAGPGWSGGLGKITIHLVNNSGAMVDRVILSNGEIIQRICPGATVTFHVTTNGSPYRNFFLSAEVIAKEGGVRRVEMWQRNYTLYATSISTEETWKLTPDNKHNGSY